MRIAPRLHAFEAKDSRENERSVFGLVAIEHALQLRELLVFFGFTHELTGLLI